MTPPATSALRAAVTAAGVAVAAAGVLAFRREDWPIYLAFVLLSPPLFLPYVELRPHLKLPIPGLATTLGFLYIGGLPIIVLWNAAPILTQLVTWALPARWSGRVPTLWGGGHGELLTELRGGVPPSVRAGLAADWGAFTLGLAARWGVASMLVPDGRPTSHPFAILLAEQAGYACWGILYVLPIYAYRPVILSEPSQRGLQTILQDITLIIILALTPFVFLITYAFEAHGLPGAVVWSFSALGLHFMLKRLNERRVTVEEQNRRLEALNCELEHTERLSAIGKMSSVVSHQMLQQLGVIGIYADLIRGEAGGDAAAAAQARAHAAAIEDALHGVNRVLTDLLVFSKDLRINVYEHPLGRLVEECVAECGADAAARGVALRVECPAEVAAPLDKLKVKQALANVIRNAIDVSPFGSAVVLRAGARDGWAEVAVTDSGPGVPEPDREAVFAPFFTTKEDGTGLGLAIAREFTEAHGGTLAVECSRGPGATFVLRLPLERPQPDESGPATSGLRRH